MDSALEAISMVALIGAIFGRLIVFLVRSNSRLPIEIVMSVFKSTLFDKFDLGGVDPHSLANASDIANLRIAQQYYRLLEKELQSESKGGISWIDKKMTQPELLDHEGNSQQQLLRSSFTSRLRQFVAPFFEAIMPFILTVGGVVIAGILVIAVARFAFLHWLEQLHSLSYIVAVAIIVELVALRARHHHNNDSDPVLQYAFGSSNLDHPQWTAREVSERGLKISLVLSEIDKAETTKFQFPPDPDLAVHLRDAPAVPGVTEIILSHHEEAIQEMRRRLNIVGLFHWRIAVASAVSFFLSIGLSVYATVFMESKAFGAVFGGLGLGVVLGVFTFLLLKNVRTSNIAIALFDSYLLELRANLGAAERMSDPSRSEKAKAKAWFHFRSGLNALWKMERSDRPQQSKPNNIR